jgi:hypothetical protein
MFCKINITSFFPAAVVVLASLPILYGFRVPEGDSAEWSFYAGGGAIAALFFFFKGFKELKHKRKIQDIPTSKIHTGAVGSDVEIKGRIICDADKLVSGPLSGTPCVFYSLEIQKEHRDRNNRRYWRTVDQFYSDEAFLVNDDSGSNALVYVEGAEIKRRGGTVDYEVSSNNFGSMHASLRQVLEKNKRKLKKFKLKNSSWLFSKNYRFLEWAFTSGEKIYVLGFAESGIKTPRKNKLSSKNFLKAKKMVEADEKLTTRFDTNKDGVLDPNELEWGAKYIGTQLQNKLNREKINELIPKTKMLFKRRRPHPFIISNMKEEALTRKMAMSSALMTFGGGAGFIVCTSFLVWKFFFL